MTARTHTAQRDGFGDGFIEACAILAADPFDRPTLAANIITETGMLSALAQTTSDGPGIAILRTELKEKLSLLRSRTFQLGRK